MRMTLPSGMTQTCKYDRRYIRSLAPIRIRGKWPLDLGGKYVESPLKSSHNNVPMSKLILDILKYVRVILHIKSFSFWTNCNFKSACTILHLFSDLMASPQVLIIIIHKSSSSSYFVIWPFILEILIYLLFVTT